ncbi:Ig-like domain-containing protein [Lactococcus fujiensis]|uniref:Ig-like domain-containing protein n=2 Tax=Lactococcus fujiensis TaxID=610251 RepID=UPI0006D1DDD6|nr:Ig-like domain-containing protein [Lactococcus fujiensis]
MKYSSLHESPRFKITRKKITHFRQWKSGKNWLYAASALTFIGAGTATLTAVSSPTVAYAATTVAATTITTAASGTVSGTGVSGDTVTVTDPDGTTTQTATVGTNGNWTVTIPSSQASGGVSATQTDGTTTSSATGASYTAATTTTPTVATLTVTTAADGILAGTGTPGDTIQWDIGGLGSSTTVAADGTWTTAGFFCRDYYQ